MGGENSDTRATFTLAGHVTDNNDAADLPSPHWYGQSMKLGPGLTFSWKRALGVTAAKRNISRATGIPLSRTGRRNKLGKFLGMK